MVSDPPNRHYGAVLTALLQERNRYHRPTWIYTPNPIASATFQGLYGAAFAAVLDTPELKLLQVTPTERSKDPGRRSRAACAANVSKSSSFSFPALPASRKQTIVHASPRRVVFIRGRKNCLSLT
jgi:hypothetical protein